MWVDKKWVNKKWVNKGRHQCERDACARAARGALGDQLLHIARVGCGSQQLTLFEVFKTRRMPLM